ncbi:hypothetical protein K1719_002383 [Acacia pycnantha]|nr:hypothetical protein K1719_002383 [Acacia pycnantha]
MMRETQLHKDARLSDSLSLTSSAVADPPSSSSLQLKLLAQITYFYFSLCWPAQRLLKLRHFLLQFRAMG